MAGVLQHMKKNQQLQNKAVPVRMEYEQGKLMNTYIANTGLGKSFIIRRCISYALSKFANDEVNILTLKEYK